MYMAKRKNKETSEDFAKRTYGMSYGERTKELEKLGIKTPKSRKSSYN